MADPNSALWPDAVNACVHSLPPGSTVFAVIIPATPPGTGLAHQRFLEEAPYSTFSRPTTAKPT